MAKTVFTDGDKSQGIIGTRLLSAFLNKIFNHRHDGLDQDGSAPLEYAVDSGVADEYDIALTPAMTQSIAGLPIQFKAANSNTGASTLKVNEVAAVPIKKGYSFALEKGDIVAGQIVTVIFDGVNFQLLNVSKRAHGGIIAENTRVINNAAGYQAIPNTDVTLDFTGKPLAIDIAVKAQNTGTLADYLQVAVEVDGVVYPPMVAPPNIVNEMQYIAIPYYISPGLVGQKTIRGVIDVNLGAGDQITIYTTSIRVIEI